MVSRQTKPQAKLDIARIRRDFPLLSSQGAARLSYLDNAATSQKPASVIEAVTDCYRRYNAPVHRGLYPLAEEATKRYEAARARLASFIGAPSSKNVIFTRSTTEAINMVALEWAESRLRPGDRVWVTRMEHHSNFLPWQRLCRRTGAELCMIELDANGELNWRAGPDLFSPRTRLIALPFVSNVLGTINPIREITDQAAHYDIPVLVDAAQAAAHVPINIGELRCDFLALSAHKMGGPTGIGLLYAKPERLAEMEPLLLGGGMVDVVEDRDSTWTEIPARFEGGSPPLAEAVGFAAAAEYLMELGMLEVKTHITDLTRYAMQELGRLSDLVIYGPASEKRAGIIAFNLTGIHPHDTAQIAGEYGVALRAGHHCCQPLMRHLGVAATVRASFAIYNDTDDVQALLAAIDQARRVFT